MAISHESFPVWSCGVGISCLFTHLQRIRFIQSFPRLPYIVTLSDTKFGSLKSETHTTQAARGAGQSGRTTQCALQPDRPCSSFLPHGRRFAMAGHAAKNAGALAGHVPVGCSGAQTLRAIAAGGCLSYGNSGQLAPGC